VARILTAYYRPKPGGYCARLFRAMRALLAQGHEVHYLAVSRFPIEHPRCHFHRFPWPPAWTDTLAFWAVFHLLAPCWLLGVAVRARVTHAFAFGTNYGLMLQPARLVRGAPLTVFVRGDALAHHALLGRGRLVHGLDWLAEGWGIAGTRLCAVSAALAARIAARHRWLRPARQAVLPNELPAAPVERPGRGPGALACACVGTFDPEKNQALAIRAMQGVGGEVAHLELYGTGRDEPALRALAAELGVSERVHFAGWVTPPARLWAAIDLLLFPSVREGCPNAVLEALAAGVPVLAADIPELREMLPAATLLPLESGAWTRAIAELARDRARLQALGAAQKAAAQRFRFDWDGAVARAVLTGDPAA